MMLEYEWGNPAAAAAAMLLFGDDTGQVDSGCHDRPQHQHPHQHQHHVFDHYGHGLGMDFFQQPQQISAAAAAAALFTTSTTSTTTSCHQQYGLTLPPAPARIGLNLGVRTYFSSGSPEEEMAMVAGRVCRRRTRTARCQAEGCGADLTHAKHYHRRHKVCEFHSKASIVITAGLSQRFCQQCSRFHVLSEFDQGKRSCRKRLADHNRRRRKSQDLSTSAASNNASNNANNATVAANNQPNPDQKKYPIAMAKLETCSSLTHVNSTQPQLLPEIIPVSPMALGLRCCAIPEAAGLSSSSSTGTSPPQSVPLLSQLGEFSHGNEHRFPSWDEAEDGEDGASIRGVYQNK